MKKLISIIFILLIYIHPLFSQNIISGNVSNEKKEPIFATNVYLKSNISNGVITDLNGNFTLPFSNNNDTLVVSFLGYITQEIPINSIVNNNISIVLKEKSISLNTIEIKGNIPISEQFSVIKMDILEHVYLNPLSQGDPLKAITFLPSSTNTDEGANVSLRGSNADRSRIVFNGVPIYNPVRATNLNNQGFFSIFNPEIIEKQNVYASNSPLTYGNSSAGLVEILTKEKLQNSSLNLSLGLAGAGLNYSQKLKNENNFFRLYSNYQFSDAMIGLQKNNFPYINNFYTQDVGLQFHFKINSSNNFNTFNYFLNESFEGNNELFTYSGKATSNNYRFFSVNNWVKYFKNGVFTFNNGINFEKKNFQFGNTKTNDVEFKLFNSLNYKLNIMSRMDIQFGLAHDYQNYKFNDSVPQYYYAVDSKSPSFKIDTTLENHLLDIYAFWNWEMNKKWNFISAIRFNIPFENQKFLINSQIGVNFKPSQNQSILLSYGFYNSYSIPNTLNQKFFLYKSNQVALDYNFNFKNTLIKQAFYYKNETTEDANLNGNSNILTSSKLLNEINTFGIELYLEQIFLKHFKYTYAFTFIKQDVNIDNKTYRGPYDLRYFMKSSIQYNNPKIFSISFIYILREGQSYTTYTKGILNNSLQYYEPQNPQINNAQYDPFHRIDLTLNKVVQFKKNMFVFFGTINNLFNFINQNEVQYNRDYTDKTFRNYMLFNFYFGCVWSLNLK